MLGTRLELHGVLKLYMDNVYFRKPSNQVLKYPCILYRKQDMSLTRANNKIYSTRQLYRITLIEQNPDSDLAERMLEELSLIDLVDYQEIDNLNHTYLDLYF